MAAIGMMVGGALVNALAFTGSNYLFSSLSSSEERKRHNLAKNSSTIVIFGTKSVFKEYTILTIS